MKLLFIFSALLFSVTVYGVSSPNTFTYQGQLQQSGSPLTDTVTMTFSLFDDLESGSQIGSTQTLNSVSVEDGLFQVMLDFGGNAFESHERWLQITVDGELLTPRQRITAVPLALRAQNGTNWESFASRIWYTDGNVGIGTSTPATPLHVVGSAQFGAGSGGAIGENSFVASGVDSVASGDGSFASGGTATAGNLADGAQSFVGGGIVNEANGAWSFVGGGGGNRANGGRAFIGGGVDNIANSAWSFIGGGQRNNVSQVNGFIGGGEDNQVQGQYSFIGGGSNNVSSGESSFVAGGSNNSAGGDESFIGGGSNNAANGGSSHIAGGTENTASGLRNFIGGGNSNNTNGTDATISGGRDNTVSSFLATVGGGLANSASAQSATVAGGQSNQAGGSFSTVPGGRDNEASADYSFAAGRRAKAVHRGSFVWADRRSFSGLDFSSTNENQFLIRAGDGVGVGTNAPETDVHIKAESSSAALILENASDVNGWGIGTGLASGNFNFYYNSDVSGFTTTGTRLGGISNTTGEYSANSDRRLKADIEPLENVLASVLQLEPSSYRFLRSGNDGVRSIGFVAQDVQAIFPEIVEGSETDDYLSLTYASFSVLAIGAIQEQQAIIETQAEAIAELNTRLKRLEQLMSVDQRSQ